MFYTEPSEITGATLLGAIFLLFLLSKAKSFVGSKRHSLLSEDQQGFMGSLILTEKTALFDGNNVYHFGLENGIGAQALRKLVGGLRQDGYRIVCFFDANIYFRLRDNGALQNPSQAFSIVLLTEVFGLQPNEVYVVPKGFQADLFIVETLSHLPVSFVVTNDRFRDFERDNPFLAEDKMWRKGFSIKQGQLQLHQYKFKHPLRMN